MIKLKILKKGIKIPTKYYDGDAGFDIFAPENVHIPFMKWVKIPLGFALEIPRDYFVLIQEKSGMAAFNGLLTIGNVVDATYRGEVHVILANLGDDILIKKGEKLAQMIVLPCYSSKYIDIVDTISQTERGEHGFGSTGKV